MKTINVTLGILAAILLFSCALAKSSSMKKAEEKMNFNFSKLNKHGLTKVRKTTLAFEFCIPNETEYLNEIKSIDESIAVYKSSDGKIGCGKNQILCIGETAGKDYIKILISLTKLPYVKNIDESFFE